MKRNRHSLSKNLMQMKFMQRAHEKDAQEVDDKSLALIDDDLSKTLRKESDKYYVNPSHAYCERLTSGRLSFKGMNPEIEKLMREKTEKNETNEGNKSEECCDVSNEEMAVRYSKLIDSPNKRKRAKYIDRVNDK